MKIVNIKFSVGYVIVVVSYAVALLGMMKWLQWRIS